VHTRMKTNPADLRREIAQLYPKRDRGDLTERVFQAKLAERTVALYRALITGRIAEGESIECEHHFVWTHFRLMQSILREPAQQATSLFLTNRRLFRLRSTIMPTQPPTADGRDDTSVDVVPLDRILALKKRFQVRSGEVLLGGIFCGIALAFHGWLYITGPFLLGLGALGVLHALLLPTRWIEVKTVDAVPDTDPIVIYGIRKKDAKNLVRCLREKLSRS